MAAHQAPLCLGFSKQEEWSGLAIPSPMYACMLRHFSFVQLCATPTRLLCPRESLGKNTGMGCYFLLCKRGRLYNNIILWMQSWKAVRKLTRWFHNKYHSPYVYVKTGYPLQYILRTMFYRYNWKKKKKSMYKCPTQVKPMLFKDQLYTEHSIQKQQNTHSSSCTSNILQDRSY